MTMDPRHLERRQVLQLLCQFDAGNEVATDLALGPVEEDVSSSTVPGEGVLQLAHAVWAARDDYDGKISELTPDWPTHRQPLVDRNILRLAAHEVLTHRTPPRVAINEAVDLARQFSTERSPAFVNGVLDRLYHNSEAASES